MKKIMVMLSLCILICSYGCASIYKILPADVVKQSKMVEVKIMEASNKYIQVNITNLTNDIVEIDWGRSNFANSGIMVSNLANINEGSYVVAPSILMPKSNTTKYLFVSDGVEKWYWWYSSGSYRYNISYPATLAIKVKQGSNEDYVVITVNAEPKIMMDENIDQPIKPRQATGQSQEIDPADRR